MQLNGIRVLRDRSAFPLETISVIYLNQVPPDESLLWIVLYLPWPVRDDAKQRASTLYFPDVHVLGFADGFFLLHRFIYLFIFSFSWRETDLLRPPREDTRGSLWSLQRSHSMPAHLRALVLNMVIRAAVVWFVRRILSSETSVL